MTTRKQALITGASSGIGRQFAISLAKSGYDIVAVARRRKLLESLATELKQFGAEVKIIVADLTTTQAVHEVIESAHGVDYLVLNAGVTHAARVGSTSFDEVEKLNTLLATGVIQVCEAIAPEMVKKKKGDIIIVSSIAAFTPMPKSALYAAAKTHVMAYGRSLHAEVKTSGVRVCVVCPGYVRTELHDNAGLSHLRERVPKFLWINASDVVESAQRGLSKNKCIVIPGFIYRITRPFLSLKIAQNIWRRITRRNSNDG